MGAAAVGEPLDPGAASTRVDLDHALDPTTAAACSRRDAYTTEATSPGNARALVRRRLGVRRTIGRPRRAGGTASRWPSPTTRRARPRRRRRSARVLQRLPPPRSRADAVRCNRRPAARSTVRTTAGRTGSTERCCRHRTSTRRDGFDRTDYGLAPVAVEEWHGWAMVNVIGSAPPLRRWVGGLEELVAPYELRRARRSAAPTRTVAANWKLPVENYQECYHCPAIHPELCTVSPPTSGDNFDGHRHVVRRDDGPRAARGDDVDVGHERRGRSAASTSSPGAKSTVHRPASRTCS